MSNSGKKPLARSLGAFVGHIARAFKTDPGTDSKRITVSKKVDEQDRGDVILRRTTIDEVEFRDRSAFRSGIEATNSELKRGHGLGRLRVRRRKRVELAVCLKVLACNLKRFIHYRLDHQRWRCAQSELCTCLEMA